MKSFNRIILVGHLASEPETKMTPQGKTLTTFALVTNEFYMNNNKEKIQETDFHRVIAWQHLADICQKYLRRGSGILLEGKLRNRNYLTKEGKKRFVTEVIAHDISILTWPERKNGEHPESGH